MMLSIEVDGILPDHMNQ